MSKLELSHSKTLKLTNVLTYEVTPSPETKLDLEILKMDNYIKSKGSQPIGPLIQYTAPQTNSDGTIRIIVKLLRQSNSYIQNADSPYTMSLVLRIKDCMYVRFIGEESNLQFAYSKITLTAYEEDIALIGDSYTIFVDRAEDTLTADIFMEKKHDS